jgi:hypothetical protein
LDHRPENSSSSPDQGLLHETSRPLRRQSRALRRQSRAMRRQSRALRRQSRAMRIQSSYLTRALRSLTRPLRRQSSHQTRAPFPDNDGSSLVRSFSRWIFRNCVKKGSNISPSRTTAE